MTDLSAQHGFQFRITGVGGGSFRSQTEQNVRKRVEKILYLEAPPKDAVLLSYVGSKELSPANNLFIGDRSDSLYANSRAGKVQEYIGEGTTSSIPVRNTNFIVTQVLNAVESGKIPLYYKHVLPLTIVAESVRVYDKNFEFVSSDKYKLEIQQEYDEASGTPALDDEGNPIYTEYHLYNNLESTYDKATGEYEVYFVQYTETLGTVDTTITELLSNELAYKEASYDDIWYVTLDLKPWAKAYTWDPVSLSIGLPNGNDYGIKYQEYKRMSVKMPVVNDDVHPWFVRVVNGSLTTTYGQYTLIYRIPEFENQAFNPMEPYKIAVRQTCTKIDDHLIKLPHEDIQDNSPMFSPFYLIMEKDGVAQYAITNDADRVGAQYRNFDNDTVANENNETVIWSSSTLLGLDKLSGIVHTSIDVDDSYELLATYSYKENYYEVTGINMNPVFDQNAHNEIRALYVVPASIINGNIGTQIESIYWVRVSASGKIVATSQDGSGNNENINIDTSLLSDSGYRLSGVLGMHYSWSANCESDRYQDVIAGMAITVDSTDGFPINGWIRFEDSEGIIRYAKFVDRSDTALILSDNPSEVAYEEAGLFIDSGAAIGLVNFVDERTTLSSRTYQYEIAHTADSSYYPTSLSRYFLLAELSINLPHSHNDAVKIDVRENGGGIRSDKYEEAKLLNQQVQWYSDFGDYDGQPYPGDAVIVVKLPISILEQFTPVQIKQLVEENIPLGVKPIIRYYGYKPRLIYVGPTGEE